MHKYLNQVLKRMQKSGRNLLFLNTPFQHKYPINKDEIRVKNLTQYHMSL